MKEDEDSKKRRIQIGLFSFLSPSGDDPSVSRILTSITFVRRGKFNWMDYQEHNLNWRRGEKVMEIHLPPSGM